MDTVKAFFKRVLAILRDNAWTGIGVLIVTIGLVGGYVTGILQWLVDQIPAVLDLLSTPITIKLWVLIAFAVPIVISVFSLGWQAYRRRQASLQADDYAGSSADESNVPTDHKLAYGVYWRWPTAWSRLERWTPRCPIHGVTMDIMPEKYDPDDGSGTHRKFSFECRGPENGSPHIIEGPDYDESYTGTMRADVYDRLQGEAVR